MASKNSYGYKEIRMTTSKLYPRQRKRVLQVITLGEHGGAQSHLLHLARGLAETGTWDIHVAIGQAGVLCEELAQAGIPTYEVPSLERSIHPLRDAAALKHLRKLIKQLAPVLVCSHSSKAGFLARLAARAENIPAIYTAHGWSFSESVPPISRYFYSWLERMASSWGARIICVSDYDRELALRKRVGNEETLVTIHNGLPNSDISQFAREDSIGVPRVVMVARFAPPKRQDLLLLAVSALRKEGMELRLDLVGDGPMMERAKALSRELNMNNMVRFLGDREDVARCLGRADIFVLLSDREGFPMTILEAMRAGLPVLAHDVGGIREAVNDGETGYLVAYGDFRSLVSKLKLLLENRDLRVRMGETGRRRFSGAFTIDRMLSKTQLIYDDVLSRWGTAP